MFVHLHRVQLIEICAFVYLIKWKWPGAAGSTPPVHANCNLAGQGATSNRRTKTMARPRPLCMLRKKLTSHARADYLISNCSKSWGFLQLTDSVFVVGRDPHPLAVRAAAAAPFRCPHLHKITAQNHTNDIITKRMIIKSRTENTSARIKSI